MSFKKSDIYGFLFFILAFIIGFTAEQSHVSVVVSIFMFIYIGRLVESRSSLHMLFFLGYSTFIFLPALLNWYYLDVSFDLFFVSSFVAVFFLIMTRNTKVKTFIDYGRSPKIVFLTLSFILTVLFSLGISSFDKPFFVFLILLLSLCLKQDNIKNNIVYMFVFVFVFVIYSTFAWSGFGRVVVVGWLLLAILQFSYSISFKVNKYAFGLLPGTAATLLTSRDFSQLKFISLEKALNDSAYGPYRGASIFINHFNQRSFDFSGLWDQIMFTFFIFIPRAVWPNKPFGFGFEYTVQHLDSYLIEAGHSVASTLIGDHIYYIGYLGVFSSLIVFSIIALAANYFYKIKGLNGNGVLVFSASIMVMVWGGMSSFSARIALPGIVFVLLLSLFRRFLTGRVKFVWGRKIE